MSRWTSLLIALAVAAALVLSKQALDNRPTAADIAAAHRAQLTLPMDVGNGAVLRAVGAHPQVVLYAYYSRDPALDRSDTVAAYIAGLPLDEACAGLRLAAARGVDVHVARVLHNAVGHAVDYDYVAPARCR